MTNKKPLFNYDFDKKIETPATIIKEQSDLLFEKSKEKIRFQLNEDTVSRFFAERNLDFYKVLAVESQVIDYSYIIAKISYSIAGFPCYLTSYILDSLFEEIKIEDVDSITFDSSKLSEDEKYIFSLKISDNSYAIKCQHEMDFKKVLIYLLNYEDVKRTIESLAQTS